MKMSLSVAYESRVVICNCVSNSSSINVIFLSVFVTCRFSLVFCRGPNREHVGIITLLSALANVYSSDGC
jgi:hypothetical protein